MLTETWHKASRSNITDCVEVMERDSKVHVRDSKNTAGPWLSFTSASWSAFLTAVKAGS